MGLAYDTKQEEPYHEASTSGPHTHFDGAGESALWLSDGTPRNAASPPPAPHCCCRWQGTAGHRVCLFWGGGARGCPHEQHKLFLTILSDFIKQAQLGKRKHSRLGSERPASLACSVHLHCARKAAAKKRERVFTHLCCCPLVALRSCPHLFKHLQGEESEAQMTCHKWLLSGGAQRRRNAVEPDPQVEEGTS